MSEEVDKAKARLLEARAVYEARQSEYQAIELSEKKLKLQIDEAWKELEIARNLYENHIREDIFSIQMTGSQVRLVLDLIIKSGYSANGYNDKLVFELNAILRP